MNPKKAERRRTGRKSLEVSCPSSLTIKGAKYPASMLDFSEIGARFTIDQDSGSLEIQNGNEIAVQVKNQFGSTDCRGKVAWACRIGDRYMLGVEFLEVSSDKRDPLRCLMESPF
jgi:hypothetical protein